MYYSAVFLCADDDSAATSSPSPRQMMALPEDLVVSEGDSASFQCIVGGRCVFVSVCLCERFFFPFQSTADCK